MATHRDSLKDEVREQLSKRLLSIILDDITSSRIQLTKMRETLLASPLLSSKPQILAQIDRLLETLWELESRLQSLLD